MTRVVAAVTTVLALGMIAPAFAAGDRDDRRDRHGWDDRGRGHGPDRVDHRHDRRAWTDDRRQNPAGYRDGYRDARPPQGRHLPPPPPSPIHVSHRPLPPHGWARGHDYRRAYRGPVYVVNDYSRLGLRHPPSGHRWIRDDRGNMLMVAIASGIIADLILHH